VDLQNLIGAKKLSAGHARALLKISDPHTQREIAERCVGEGWSVRQIEAYTKLPQPASGPKPKREPVPQDPNVKAAIGELESRLGTRVRIIGKGRDKGLIEIEYYSVDDLDRIYNIIAGDPS
jgi:ParB family chromosome partitioning protein